ncbi:MAG: hypothetical protein N3F64_00825 [Nitrososphaeria archaeon]|nr:hypothetical protein [Nitrososphaeria archaeon]
MSQKELVLSFLNKQSHDRIPFAHCDRHLPRGELERIARNMGMALLCYRPCYIEYIPNVELTVKYEGEYIIRKYETRFGSLFERLKVGVGYGQACFGRDWKGLQPIRTSFMVKSLEDYRILKFIAENLHFKPYYYPVEDQTKRLGNDGIVISTLPYEPMQRLIIEWIGHRIYLDMVKNKEIVEEIYNILEEKYEKELFPIAAEAPSKVILYGGNIDSLIVNPKMFEKYYLPTYEKLANILHAKGKLLDVHMDGKLKALSNLISKSKVDIIEAFTPPPTGDLPIEDALAQWEDKIIWINFPSAISTAQGPNPQYVKRYLIELLEKSIPYCNRIMVIASTENYVPEENLLAMAEVMEKAIIPLNKNVIEEIRKMCLN